MGAKEGILQPTWRFEEGFLEEAVLSFLKVEKELTEQRGGVLVF